jgi:hypothetical protein
MESMLEKKQAVNQGPVSRREDFGFFGQDPEKIRSVSFGLEP